MKKRGFTFVEILFTLIIIGILILIVVPTIKKVMPNENAARVRKAYNTLTNVVSRLVDDEDLYDDGNLSKKADGSDVAESYFCHNFANTVNVLSEIPACIPSIGISNPTATPADDLDKKCGSRSNNFAFKTADGIRWYGMFDKFSNADNYVVVCIRTDDNDKNSTYGFGVRQDGRIIVGENARKILDKDSIK